MLRNSSAKENRNLRGFWAVGF